MLPIYEFGKTRLSQFIVQQVHDLAQSDVHFSTFFAS